jgi:hypothetical protein
VLHATQRRFVRSAFFDNAVTKLSFAFFLTVYVVILPQAQLIVNNRKTFCVINYDMFRYESITISIFLTKSKLDLIVNYSGVYKGPLKVKDKIMHVS